MPNPFEIYEIDHLSPSSCNTFVAEPALFILQKVFKLSTPVGAAAHRGTAVEEGIVHGLFHHNASHEECAEIATNKFRALTALSADPRKEKEEAGLSGMVAQGLAELRPYGVPTATQSRVEIPVPGCSVPLMGFSDVFWDQHALGTDIKTTHACPAEISVPHARQTSLYKHALAAREFRVSYITPKKAATYVLESPEQHLETLFRICRTIEKVLSISSDKEELKQYFVPDVDSFYYNDPLARRNALEVFGI